MPASRMSLFFTLLALAASVPRRRMCRPGSRRHRPAAVAARRGMSRELGTQNTGLAAAVAGIATSDSLYYSKVTHFVPCMLCWVQRASCIRSPVSLPALRGGGGRCVAGTWWGVDGRCGICVASAGRTGFHTTTDAATRRGQ